MSYQLLYADEALHDLQKMDRVVSSRILRKLQWLAANAAVLSHEAMTGNWAGFFRIRIGDYRAIYTLDAEQQIIEVEVVGHRRDVYEG